MNIIRVPISKCEPWEKNPRGIKKKDFERLKKQIQELGVYKPLVACMENGKYIILGGNMRIRALKELGHKEVDISIVEAPSDVEKIKYSLSDNDRAGYYEEEKLAELVFPHIQELDLKNFEVDFGTTFSLEKLLKNISPDYLYKENKKIPKISFPENSEEQLEFFNRFENFIVQFSGGKDSLLALLWAKEISEKFKKPFSVRFVETGAEFPCLSSYVRRICQDLNVNLDVVSPKESILSFYLRIGRWPDPVFRDCQSNFINKVIDEHLPSPERTLQIRGGRPDQKETKTPKTDFQIVEGKYHLYNPFYFLEKEKYLELLEAIADIVWPGYKKGFLRTACWICPFQKPEQWEVMKEVYPLLWEEMRLLSKKLKFPSHPGDGFRSRFLKYWAKEN